ncbi:RNA 2',3'-cyclic phosphodiesterase [Candidatus Pacearchaeota archaeon]|nr:RNA 2',3'-cyclic phosphodiesterase [Candidatus Pacearchaeota archaeon]
MRTFIALDLPKEIIKEIQGIQKILKQKSLFTGKFTESENLHLTLKFFGEIDETKVEEVKKRLSEIKMDGFYCEIGEVGVFTKSFIKIIWIKLNGKGIFNLQKEIDEKLSGLLEPEERFMSHLTIARVKHVSSKKDLLDYLKSIKPKKSKFYCNRFYLKKSELKPEGPVYEYLAEYKLD